MEKIQGPEADAGQGLWEQGGDKAHAPQWLSEGPGPHWQGAEVLWLSNKFNC